jgi:hypothetical protein
MSELAQHSMTGMPPFPFFKPPSDGKDEKDE